MTESINLSTETPGQEPLAGLRVLEFGHYGAAPLAAMMLADMGADVIKVESPGGDVYRGHPPFQDGESHYFMAINRNKRSVKLDLKDPRDVERFKQLAAQCDVLIENMRPGVMARLGLAPELLQAANPRLIFCSVSGYGQTGPLSHEGSHDLVIQALTGMMDSSGEAGRDPIKLIPAVPDVLTAYNAAFNIMTAVHARNAGRPAGRVDVSLFDSSLYSMSLIYLAQVFGGRASPERMGSGHPQIVPLRAYADCNGKSLVTGASDPRMWQALCTALEMPELATDPRFVDAAARRTHRDALDAILEKRLAERSRDVWLAALIGAGVPSGPVNSLSDAIASPQALARGMRRSVDHPRLGPIHAIGLPAHHTPNGGSLRRVAPLLGEHNDEVFKEFGIE